MAANIRQPEIEIDLVTASRVLYRANAFVLANLSSLVDTRGLREGDWEEDYFVDLPSRRLHEVGSHLTRLERLALDRFNVGLGVMPIPIKDFEPAL